MRATSGNLSVVLSRDPLRLAVTVSGVDKGSLTAADIVVVDADGKPVPAVGEAAGRPPPARPSAEAALHARVARVTGAGAVVHVHTVAAVLAARRWPAGIEFEDLEMLKAIGQPAEGRRVTLPVVDNSQSMRELADRLAKAHDPDVPAVVVAGHGLYVWGADPLRARHHTEAVQWLLELRVAGG